MKTFLPKLKISQTLLLVIGFVLFIPTVNYAQVDTTTQIVDQFFDYDQLGGPVYIGEVEPFTLPADNTLMKSAMIKTSPILLKSTVHTELEWPDPGSVHIEKYATPTGTEGRWKITVKVEGKNIPTTTDVVLVIDDSGSMGTTKMNAAKNAASDFVDELLTGTTGIRIAVVTINGGSAGSGTPEVDQGFTSNIGYLQGAIDDIDSDGGTNLQGGFYAAKQLVASSTADKQVVILLSDGVPTYSYQSNVTSSVTPVLTQCWPPEWDYTPDEIEDNYLFVNSSNYNNVVGSGGDFDFTLFSVQEQCYNGGWRTRTFSAGNHGIPTKYEAALVMANADVYTIGFDVPSNGDAEDVLMGSQNKGYFPANSGNISNIYSEIRSNISFAASNSILTDPMSTYIVLEAGGAPTYTQLPTTTGDVVVTKGSVTATQNGYVLNDPDNPASGNSSIIKWQLAWNIGTVSEQGDSMYYYVNMAPNTDPTILYPANDKTYLDYTDVNEDPNAHQETEGDFSVPWVSGGKGSIEIHYYLVNSSGQPISSNGTVVTDPKFAYQIPQSGSSSSLFNDGSGTALDVNQSYSVAPQTPLNSSNGTTYVVHSNYNTSQNITLTSSEPNKDAWFGYTIGCIGTVNATYTSTCVGSPLQLTATTTNITDGTYSWTGPDGFTSDQQNPIVPAGVAGTYSVGIEYNNGNCTISDDVVVTLEEGPAVSIEGDVHVCAGSDINLYEVGGEATSWSWTGPNGYTSTDSTPTFATTTSDNFSGFFVVTASNGTCTTKDSIQVIVTNSVISKTGCPTDIVECADEIVDNNLVKYIEWQTPNFGLNCLGGESGNYSFVMEFGLPEVKWACWEFNSVQRVGNNSGVVNLWQSNGTGDPYILSPTVYLEPGLDVFMDIYAPTGENFDWTLILVDETNQEHVVNSTPITGDNTTKNYSISIPNTFVDGAYKLKFKFSENGSGEPKKSVVDNIYFDAIILDNAGCEGGIEFIVEGPRPGYFPIINDSTLTYTATYTPSSGDPIVETCSFKVTVEGIDASSSSTDAKCGEDNGTITINATPYSSSPNLEYSLNGGIWTSFSGTNTTIEDLAPGNYTINVRDISTAGNCELLSLLNEEIEALPQTDVTIGEFGPYCSDAPSITLNGQPAGGIYKGDGVNQNGEFTPTNSLVGFNVIWYVYEDNNGCTDSASTVIQVENCCTETVTALVDDNEVCEGEPFTLSAQLTNGTSGTYLWYDINENYLFAGDSTIASANLADGKAYIVEATYNSSCVDRDTVVVEVNETYTVNENAEVDTTICEADLPFNYEGTEFTAADSKDITFQTVNGCDSIVTVNLTVNPTFLASETTPVDTTICEADLPFNYEGTEFTAADSKDITFQTVNGCDSIVTVNLTVNPTFLASETTPVDTTICEADLPFNYEGTEFTAADSKDITFQTVNGCDSIVTVNLTVNPTYLASETTPVDTTICEADLPFNYEGTEFTAADSKDITFQTVNGCDSIVTVNLTVNPTFLASETTPVDTTICEADLPFNYEGTEFTAADSKDITFQTVNGCDSIVTVNLTVNPTYLASETTPVDTTICEADLPFNYEGTEFTAADSKDITFQTVNGCDSIVTVNLTVNPTFLASETTPVDTTICEADLPFNYEGTEFTAADSKDITFQTVNGCDSIVTVNLTVNPTYLASETTPVDTTICEADLPFNYEGTEFTAADSKDITFQTVNGCDSIVTVNLTVNPTYLASETTPVDTTICEADLPFNYEGTEFTAADSKDITFQTVNGCDSIVTVNLTVNPTYLASETTPVDTTICEADLPFNYEGTEFTAADSKDITFQTVNGCDSIVTVNLTVNPTYLASETTPVDTTICEADLPFNYEGTEFTAADSKDITFQTVNGCDSIVTVNLTVNPTFLASETTPVDTTICEADLPFNYEGTEFTAADSKDITFQTVNGCDSIVTVNLTVNPTFLASETTPVDTTICEADLPFNYEGTEFTAADSKDITFQTVNGCDSIVTVNLTVNPTFLASETTPVDTTICEADLPFNYEGTEFTAADSKDITFQTVNGCDSIVTVNLTVNPTFLASETTPVDTTICEADLPFNYEGTEFTAADSKDITFQTVNGCDSIVTVNLTVNPTFLASETTPVDTTICEADLPFNYEGTEFTAADSKDITFQTVNGCDSIVTVNLTVNPTFLASETTPVDTTICEADLPFNYEGTEFTAADSKDITFQTVNGCDSIVTVNLTVNPTFLASETTPVDTTICEADLPFNYEGTEFTAADSKDITFQTVNGCDSIVTVNLTVNPTYLASETTPVDTTICEADLPFNYEGTQFTAADSKDITFQTVNGCDSIVTVNLTVNPTFLASETTPVDTTICEADLPFNYEGTEFTAADSKDITFQTVNGCDSIVTVTLTVLESTSSRVEVAECDSYTWNGTTYNESGTYTFETTNAAGCDSVATLVLTILESGEQTITRTECNSYTFNGTTYNESGTYTIITENNNGCTLTTTLNLTILETTYGTDTQTVCNEFTWIDGNTYTENNNTATYTIENAAGCDSIVTLDLTILDPIELTSEASDLTVECDGLGNTAEFENWLLSNGATGTADVGVGDITWSNDYEGLTSGCGNTGETTVTFTAMDECGNTVSTTATFRIEDTTAPDVICNDITVQLDANGVASISVDDIDGGTTDNCGGIDTLFISQENFYCENLGENVVTLTAIDECGNVSTCTATVTVEQGEYDCGVQPFNANDDILTLIYCPGGTVSGSIDLFANDEGFTRENVSFNILTDLPDGVSVTDGELLYVNEAANEAVLTFTYSVCHTVNTENCDTAEVTIHVLLDTDCDGIPNRDDIDDDDDGILDIIEEENALNQTTLDSDGDGIVDRLDIDSDNDGIPDNIEWQQNIEEGILYGSYSYGTDMGYDYYPPLGTDENSDGWDDRYDRDGFTYEPVDMDGDGTPDYLDIDSDGDGLEDWIEGWDAAPHDTIADTDIGATDSDGDGLFDNYDSYDTSEEWLHGLNAIGSFAPLQDMAADTANNIRDWRDVIEPSEQTPEPLASSPYIPDGFSPNQDSYNDYFQIVMRDEAGTTFDNFGEAFPDAKIEIYNRWGNRIYQKANYGNYNEWGTTEAWWDGTSMHDMQIGNDKLPTATYFYILYLNNGSEPITGSIFLNN
ncbi:T9SS type B sorting domain-containing protein [Draconibacterium halophilum]|uniref:VWA domain-containing protein n=1 Tax=Draconibacterium halophilum TaxID=2706887 RepID=A0A6C0RGV4_9BACT|nr:gliding motility-associated C-terminal domain-containing protein [Draconibacterium halophilum]QIA08905.1 VWA domain-containing protein [Draconibacterium halophilum]